jgi:hypothetical protein
VKLVYEFLAFCEAPLQRHYDKHESVIPNGVFELRNPFQIFVNENPALAPSPLSLVQ